MNTSSKHSLKDGNEDNSKAKDTKIKSINADYSLNSIKEFIQDWEEDFIERMFYKSKTTRSNWDYRFAKKCTSYFEPLDKLIIQYKDYIKSDPLNKNDYFKYCDAYFRGKKLDIKYFRHDVEKLNEYYKKIDEEFKTAKKENRKPIPKFSGQAWERCVLFMMLKLNGLYRSEYDKLFHVKEDKFREYNPLANLPSVFRAVLPMAVKECDIKQANPTFIFKELGIEPFDVYAKYGGCREKAKKKFNSLINMHSEKSMSIDEVRDQLRPIYGERVDEVITEQRFNNKGKMQMDMAKHEKEAIEQFVKANNLKNYVRLHDGLFVLDSTECDTMEFGIVKFGVKQVTPPAIVNNYKLPYKFKTTNEGKEKLITNPVMYADFFKQENFNRLKEEGKDEISILKNDNKIVNRYNWKSETIYFLTQHINENDKYKIERLKNRFSKDLGDIMAGFKLIKGEPLNLHRDTKEAVYIPFKNAVAKITVDEVNMIDYSDENIGFFMESEPLKHNFKYSDESANKSVFKDFLFRAIIGRETPDTEDELTKEETHRIHAFCSMIGYMVSNYKNPSESFAIILSDEGATIKVRRGRRGKGLVQKAIEKVCVFNSSGGDTFDAGYRHKYADLKKEHDVYIVDDVPAKFPFKSFYSEIKEGITIEPKGSESVTIPFEWTPKFIFSTNFALPFDEEDTSTIDRFIEYQFTDYWSIDRKPNEVYKHNFFTDWNEEQWNEFYSFIVGCVQIYLDNGLMRINYDKTEDNYRAYFFNEVMEEEFIRIFELMKERERFTAGDFLKEYQKFDNPLMKEKFFHRNNVKKLIEVYIEKHTDIKIRYSERGREWIFESNDNIPF